MVQLTESDSWAMAVHRTGAPTNRGSEELLADRQTFVEG
jgi:hypothetical protein